MSDARERDNPPLPLKKLAWTEEQCRAEIARQDELNSTWPYHSREASNEGGDEGLRDDRDQPQPPGAGRPPAEAGGAHVPASRGAGGAVLLPAPPRGAFPGDRPMKMRTLVRVTIFTDDDHIVINSEQDLTRPMSLAELDAHAGYAFGDESRLASSAISPVRDLLKTLRREELARQEQDAKVFAASPPDEAVRLPGIS